MYTDPNTMVHGNTGAATVHGNELCMGIQRIKLLCMEHNSVSNSLMVIRLPADPPEHSTLPG